MEKEIREFVKNTFLIPKDLKKKILMRDTWNRDLYLYLKSFYEKYSRKEKKILKDINRNKLSFYLKTLQLIEKKIKQNEMKEIKKIEEKLENM